MFNGKIVAFGVLIAGMLYFAGIAGSSSCVDCHTDVAKLKAIAKTLPKKEASAETAGKG
ncbi:hypothetical protein SAMN02745165_03411 [Malonomonas rubra DSM 5091]|uniref:Cytochrome c domain-containing protein n=1 Tax=Malonomonas rubra DSM 5091 TaxID=1122189 RepID=A0A1M6MUP0_MALRU|nr:hypothetical protein [Malonomonas rubra]SHJ87225.1 hypothetical protein SAMN02745165_03411 [Malonomonas rubra DSM 5091]